MKKHPFFKQFRPFCILLPIAIGIAFCIFFSVSAWSQPGVLDQTFGNNGKVYFPIPFGTAEHPVDIKVQTDGKILVVTRIDTPQVGCGSPDAAYFWMYRLWRFNSNGTVDNSFGTNGTTAVVYYERPTNIELLANGQILLNSARFTTAFPQCPTLDFADLCLTRYNANGSIDNTFGTNGRAITRFDTSKCIAMSVFVLPGGKIIQGGVAFINGANPNPGYAIFAGFDQNGNIDPTYGNNGKVKVATNWNYSDYYYPGLYGSLSIRQTYLMLPNQKIVVPADTGFFRFNSNGSVDATFGTNGFVKYPRDYYYTSSPFQGVSFLPTYAGLLEPNGKMVFLMRTVNTPGIPSNQSPLRALRFNADGSPDTTFTSVILDDDFNGSSWGNQYAKIFPEPNSQYSFAIGVYNDSYGYAAQSCIGKLNNSGTLDSSYGRRGKINTHPSYYTSVMDYRISGNAAALQTDGKMVVAGAVDTLIPGTRYGQTRWVIARYEKNARMKYNTLVANVFNDRNANGIKDATEEPYNCCYLISTAKPGADTVRWSNYRGYGEVLSDVDTGTYHSSAELFYKPYYTVVPAIRTTSHNTYWNTDTLSFAVQPVAGIRDLSVRLIRLSAAKPGFPIHYVVKVHNAGTDTAGNVVVKFVKNNKMVYDSATTSPASIVADTIAWNMGSLQPLHDAFVLVHGTVNPPPAVNVGDVMQVMATITSDKRDTTAADDTASSSDVVVGSWDPNDKSESHGGRITHAKAAGGEYLTYTIRFQNTGNDTAFHIYIKDTLDSKLDWNTFQMLDASAGYQVTMNDGKLKWSFMNIMLVDSVHNEPLSHGYIAYRIKPKSTVQVGDVIKNSASIYFDYNLPVKTNTESTTVVADVMPLRLLTFTAKKDGKVNRLQWHTVNEENVDRFEVERSGSGREYNSIGDVSSELSVVSAHNYKFTDNSPLPRDAAHTTHNYYRLKMLDKDGSFTYSPVRVVNNNSSFTVSVHPNPVKDKLQVKIMSGTKATLQVQVVAQDGKVMLAQEWNINEGSVVKTINTSALQSGSYFIRITSAEKEQRVVGFEKM